MIEILWQIFELFITIFESFVVIHFVYSFFDFNFRKAKNAVAYIVAGMSLAITINVMNSITIYEGVYGFIYSFVILIFSLIFLDGSLVKKIILSITANLSLVIASSLSVSLIFNISNENIEEIYMHHGIPRFVTIVFAKVILLYIFIVIRKATNKKGVKFKLLEWLLIISVLLISSVIFMFLRIIQLNTEMSESVTHLILFSELALSIMNIVCYYVIIRLSEKNMISAENELLKQQIVYQNNYAEKTKQEEQTLQRLKHDLKQSISVINNLLHKNEVEIAKEFIFNYEKVIKSVVETRIFTDNEFVNAIINTKFSHAKNLGIETFCSSVSSFGDVNDVDLCNLLGNLLDNSIEACEKITDGEKVIELKIMDDESRLIIHIKNTVSESVLKSNAELQTSKRNKKIHGYGVSTIKSIAEKYNGHVDYYEDNGMFCCQIALSNTADMVLN